MEVKLIKKRKTRIRPFVLLLTIIMCLGISFATVYFVYTYTDERDNTIVSGLITIDFKETGDVINLDTAVPVIDAVGKKENPYTFTVKNTSDNPVPINVSFDLIIDNDVTTIPLSAVHYALFIEDEEVASDTLDNYNAVEPLYTYESVAASALINVRMHFWIDYYYDTPKDATSQVKNGQTFKAKIQVTGESIDYIAD